MLVILTLKQFSDLSPISIPVALACIQALAFTWPVAVPPNWLSLLCLPQSSQPDRSNVCYPSLAGFRCFSKKIKLKTFLTQKIPQPTELE